MYTECEAKEAELLYIHKQHARVVTENYRLQLKAEALRERVDELARENVRLARRLCDIEPERSA